MIFVYRVPRQNRTRQWSNLDVRDNLILIKEKKLQWYWKKDIPFLQLDLGRIRTRLSTNEFLEVPDCIFRATFDTDWRGGDRCG